MESTSVGDIPGQAKKHTVQVMTGYMRDAALQVYHEMWEGSESELLVNAMDFRYIREFGHTE